MSRLNPQYKRDIVPAKPDKPYVLKLPIDQVTPFINSQSQIFAYNREKYFPDNQLVPIKEGRDSYRFNIEGKTKIYYIVKSGDHPKEIANKYKVSVASLCEWNNIRQNKIKVGQKLAIYTNKKAQTAKDKSSVSKTQISQTQNSENAETQKSPSVKSENTLNSEYTVYTVRNGDSLYTIAKRFAGVSDVEIKLLNNIKNAKNLVVGQKLKIPVKA
jgi:membrane-bound lytic murein transglycosylase D